MLKLRQKYPTRCTKISPTSIFLTRNQPSDHLSTRLNTQDNILKAKSYPKNTQTFVNSQILPSILNKNKKRPQNILKYPKKLIKSKLKNYFFSSELNHPDHPSNHLTTPWRRPTAIH